MSMSETRQIVETQFAHFGSPEVPVLLRSGHALPGLTVAYETYGELNAAKSNAILIFHGLTGSQHAAGHNAKVPGVGSLWTRECEKGWWEEFIGPGKALDTRKFHIICANYLGGCYGSTGPSSPHPADGKPYGTRFPRVEIADIVDSQMLLLDHLGIARLHAVVGASLGGMMCLSMATRYPDRVGIVVPVATGVRVTALSRIHNFEQIMAIESDPNFRGGDYYGSPAPLAGLALARMIGHKTFISLHTLEQRARKDVLAETDHQGWYQLSHSLESYMRHQGRKFVKRFDANTYLRLLDAWQHFSLVDDHRVKSLPEVFAGCRHQTYMVFSINSDVCFYPEEQSEIINALKAAKVPCMHITVHSDKGHDAFLLEPNAFTPHLVYTLGDPEG